MILKKLTSLLVLTPAMIGCGDSMEKQKRLPLALNRCIVDPVQTETRHWGATKRKEAIMFVTIDRSAIESAICNEYPESERYGWYTAVCRYGVLAVSESWDDCQDAIMDYAERGAEDENDVECQLAECGIRTATDTEVINALIKRELHNVELGAQCTDSIGQFKRQILVELVALGYPEDGFIRFDDAEPCYHYYEGDMGFKVSPLF